MTQTTVFKRYELKYLLTQSQYDGLKKAMTGHMKQDEYGRHTISNIYFDTPDYLLIRRSMEKPDYKEKLRVRCYGAFHKDSKVFVELKKKYDGVVYKRRLCLPQKEALDFLLKDKPLQEPSQIGRELAYVMGHYGTLAPAMALRYQREAFFCETDPDFRLTFDQDVTMSTQQLTLENRGGMTQILPQGMVLLEVKTRLGLPLWLTNFLSANQIYKTSFSKYGAAYQSIMTQKGGVSHVA